MSNWAGFRVGTNSLICQNPDCKHHLDYHFVSQDLKAPCMYRVCKCDAFTDKAPKGRSLRI